MNTRHLIYVLTESSRRHGSDKILTVGHLLNIVTLAQRMEEREEQRLDECLQEVMDGETPGSD